LPSSSFITVFASSSSNCPNILPGTILPTHFSAASSISIDSSLMTTISSPFLSFPLSQSLSLPPLFSNTSNLSQDFTDPQLTMSLKPDNVLTPDSFMSDTNCDTVDKQEEKDGSICYCCGGPPTCEESFLLCKDCGLNAHPTCLDYWPELTERAHQSPWQCSDCKTCTICFHIECHRLKLEESIDGSLPWVCANYQDKGYRVSIGTLPSSINNRNYSSPNKTEECNDDLKRTPLKETNSSYEYIKTESKQELDELLTSKHDGGEITSIHPCNATDIKNNILESPTDLYSHKQMHHWTFPAQVHTVYSSSDDETSHRSNASKSISNKSEIKSRNNSDKGQNTKCSSPLSFSSFDNSKQKSQYKASTNSSHPGTIENKLNSKSAAHTNVNSDEVYKSPISRQSDRRDGDFDSDEDTAQLLDKQYQADKQVYIPELKDKSCIEFNRYVMLTHSPGKSYSLPSRGSGVVYEIERTISECPAL
ncbi:unnamed protein product, partial [Schistosoma margrebowiei]